MTHHHHLVLYHTVTPLHVGCGQDVGVVDLPVIRERTTGYPFIPGSGTRGALRAAYQAPGGEDTKVWKKRLFGPEVGGDDESQDDGAASGEEERYAGSVSVHDAKLLLLPVRSTPGVYVWITGPTALRRLRRDLEAFGLETEEVDLVPDLKKLAPALADDRYLGPRDLGMESGGDGSGRELYLEEYAYGALDDHEGLAEARQELKRWAGKIADRLGLADELPDRTVLVSDAAFHHFCRFATVVQQHNKLTSAKTVDGTALFSVEAVPPDAVFHGLVGAAPQRWPADRNGSSGEGEKTSGGQLSAAEVMKRLRQGYPPGESGASALHLGGGESTGLGVTRLVGLGSATKATKDGGGGAGRKAGGSDAD